MFLFGDFNIPGTDWPTLSTPSHNTQMFIILTLDFHVKIIYQPIRLHKILELCLASDPDILASVSFTDGFSDHELIHMNVLLSPQTKTFFFF